MMQLISPKIHILAGRTYPRWKVDERGVMEKFGVTPDRVIDVLALIDTKQTMCRVSPGSGEDRDSVITAIRVGRKFTLRDGIPQKGSVISSPALTMALL
jgi:hypothetical protein